ncbi:MAG: hypothetical protein HFH72_09170 [Lachnospiraceae bacterium]|nr:hypothetical protein [Lachnospiraceae bacterium]
MNVWGGVKAALQRKEVIMKKIYKDSVLFRKLLYIEHFVHYDSFGENEKFEYDILLYRCYTLQGRVYQIQMPNCTMNGKNIGRLMARAIEYAAAKFPQSFRLEDYLVKKDIWRKL